MKTRIVISRRFLFTFLGGVALALIVQAQDQSGFLSLDCGLPANASSYTEPWTKIEYISDAAYINTGESRTVTDEYKKTYQRQLWYLRSFPQGTRNCYNISIMEGTQYLIRANFLYGNYDGLNKHPIFDLYFGDTRWRTVESSIFTDLLHIPSTKNLQICLMNIGHGTPFISALELRQFPNVTYPTISVSLNLNFRLDMGSTTNTSYRFPYDVYDRIWSPYNEVDYAQLNTSDTVDADDHNNHHPAAIVMETAATPRNGSKSINFSWFSADERAQYYVYFHFAELEKLQSNQTRGFNVTHNGDYWDGPIIPDYLSTTTIYDIRPLPVPATRHQFSFFPIENSTLPPIINALEIYSAIEISELESNKGDVDAIINIRSTYGVNKNWQGDPCVPRKYPWSGLSCSTDLVPRIISLNLSSSGLKGEISSYIIGLKMLQKLDLSNNNLTGKVPEFLSQLSHLEILILENNNLTGSLPPELIKKRNDGSLSLSVQGNPNLDACILDPCTEKKPEKNSNNKNFIIPVVASIGGLFAILIIAGIIYWITKSKKKQVQGKDVALALDRPETNTHFGNLEMRRQQFTYTEVVRMTNNFEMILGKGGFGTVYHGVLDDIQVAVKMISPSAIQGYHQFQAEVTILMRVHHRNLTSLVGHLNEGTHLGLIYEYMANGNLAQHLSEKSSRILSWEDRLRIAMDAAQGLEYMHDGCKPPIVHRDVKTTNILLTENFQGKLSDFGLSKSYPTDEKGHMFTVVAGTPGYLDPEYSTSNKLTEKSDVYSFGIALLEIVSCRPVILKTQNQDLAHIVKWAGSMAAQGDVRNIVDPRLKGRYDINSAWKAVEIAMACVSVNSSRRPTMSQVVAELKVCLATELSRTPDNHPNYSTDSIEMASISFVLPTQSEPEAR